MSTRENIACKQENPSDDRVAWIDYAKAIGLILMVYGHVSHGIYNAGIPLPEPLYQLVDSIIYSFHMPLFFFLAGLLFYPSFTQKGAKKIVFSKVDTILYPYLIWSILQGSLEVILSNYTNGNITLPEVLSVWDPRAQFWFLYALFFIFLVIVAVYSIMAKKLAPTKRHAVIFTLAAFLYLNHLPLPELPALIFIYNNLVFFIFGILFSELKGEHRLNSIPSLLLLLTVFIAAQLFFHGYLGKTYTDIGLESLALALVSILFVVSLSITLSKVPNRLVTLMGASSMVIYLTHVLAGSGVRVIVSHVIGIESATIHLLAGCLAGLFLPLLAIKIINAINIPYLFNAPLSKWLSFSYNKALHRASH